ncbi:MAG: DUF1223 domain-containing protein [Burkholderiales bacterium]
MTIHPALRFVAALAALGTALSAPAAPCTARSTSHTAALVELYTSEGCSSCPPADRWLSSLESAGRGVGDVVPLALHVDYWDYIGWQDPYAKPAFTARQRRIAALQHAPFVYTPQVLLQGRDFQGWGSTAFELAVGRINAQPARADLSLAIERQTESVLQIEVSARVPDPKRRATAALYLAVYQNKLSSHVAAGENTGRTLTHDFVVRGWLGPIDFAPDGRVRDRRGLTLPSGAAASDAGVVAFVQDRATAEVLQALKLPACPG